MAKVKTKSGLGTVNKILFIVFIALLVATIIIVATTSVAPVSAEVEGETGEFKDTVAIDEFVAGTYGGKEFKTVDDVVNYYNECFNYTKTLTAEYTVDGATQQYYKLLGDENLNVGNLLIEGKANKTIEKLVPGVVSNIFKGGVKGLSPSASVEAKNDKKDDGAIDLSKSLLAPEDVLMANVKENSDGTISITIQPKYVILSMPGKDAQGKFFNTLGDISGVVSSISILSFSEGTVDDNFVVNYNGGSGVVTIDPKTGEITAADYTMKVHIDVKHANVAVIKDKSASLDITYTNHYPASADYLAQHNIVAK